MLAAWLAYKRPGWPTDPVYGDSTTQNHFSPGCWGTSWHTSLKLLIHSLWLVLENPPSEGSGLRDGHKLCQHPALSRADLSPVCYEQRVTEVFLREAVDSIASRSNEKAHLSQRQDPSLPSNRADPLYGANIHLSFCFPVYCAIPAE